MQNESGTAPTDTVIIHTDSPRSASGSLDPERQSGRLPSPSTFEVNEVVDTEKIEEEETIQESSEEQNHISARSQLSAQTSRVRNQGMTNEGTNLTVQVAEQFHFLKALVLKRCKIFWERLSLKITKRALLIGIRHDDDPTTSALTGPHRDVRSLRQLLISK